MKLKSFHSVSVFILCQVFLLLFSPLTQAETFSGRVVDGSGNPVPDVTVALHEYKNEMAELSITDDDGDFSITSTSFPVKLNLHPKNNTPYAISRIIIDGIIYYPGLHPNFSKGLVFSIVGGVDIKNVQIQVRKRTLIRGRVLNPDGTPLSNVDVRLDLSGQSINGSSPIIRGMLIQLDAEGYFQKYVDGPGYYTFSVEYQKKIATTDEMFITGKPEKDKLVLMLGGKTATNLNDEEKDLQKQLQRQHREISEIEPITTLSSKEKSSFSGRVVDTQGNTVSELQIGLKPMQLRHGLFFPEMFRIGVIDDISQTKPIDSSIESEDIDNKLPPRNTLISVLSTTGTFSFNEIEYGPLRLFIRPDYGILESSKKRPDYGILESSKKSNPDQLESEFEIFSIRIGSMIFGDFIDHQFSPLNQGTFAINPGAKINNVKITVKRKASISGKIVYADGTPLKSRITKLRIKEPQGKRVRLGDADGYTSSVNIQTDDYGNFSIYVEKPGDYYFHVKYILLSAEAGPITIKDEVQQEDLILKLNGKLLFPDSSSEDQATADEEQLVDVWVVNPSNGHSYKLIECEDWYDAHHKAIQNGAHLISINDEAEHKWISEIFGRGFFWIGLNDLEKEGEWKWDGGEAVTYEVWEKNELFLDGDLTDAEKDYVVMNLNGAWQSTGPQSTIWFMTRQAILENDGLLSTIQPQSESQDE